MTSPVPTASPATPCLHGSTQALQRGLPRPLSLDTLPRPRPASEQGKLSLREQAEDLVVRELGALLAHDSARYPVLPAAAAKDKEAKKVGGGAGCDGLGAWVGRGQRVRVCVV